jgi:hypothetical protein
MTAPLYIDTRRSITFSVEFRNWSGQAAFEVEPLAKDGTTLAYGRTLAFIRRHEVAPVVVSVYPDTTRPEHRQGGAMADGDLACVPQAPADACGLDSRTCGVLCSEDDDSAVSLCYLAGTGGPGALCISNRDCAPGTQCFPLSAGACPVKTCLKFCSSDSECGDSNAFCNLRIPCGDKTFLACSRPCDPTVTSNNGCAAGLGCFVYSGDTTDCACPGVGRAGAACIQNEGCAPGLICLIPKSPDAGATGVCRPVCKLDAPACPSGTSCHAFDDSPRRLYGSCQ